MKAKVIYGGFADAGELESDGIATIEFIDGEHAGHRGRVRSAKFDCGAYSETISCLECKQEIFANAMNGCWQWGHQRDEEGTPVEIDSSTVEECKHNGGLEVLCNMLSGICLQCGAWRPNPNRVENQVSVQTPASH
jgi:hypothetical protein